MTQPPGDHDPYGQQPDPYTQYTQPYAEQPPGGGPPPYGQQPGAGGQPPRKGFFGSLFDFSFEHFVTPMLVKAVYIVAIVALGLGWLIWVAAGFSQSAGFGVGGPAPRADPDLPLPLPDPDDAGVLPRHHPDEPGHPPPAALTPAMTQH